jgi:hypothetical protein
MFERLKRALEPDHAGGAHVHQPTLETLVPGDVVSIWDVGDCVVQVALDCSEELNGRTTRWRWNLLDEGRMIEVGPDGRTLYTRTLVLHQSAPEFEILTCDPAEGGVLKAFEARVREGTAARNPVLFEVDGGTYRVTSTGIFAAQPAGAGAAGYGQAEVWRDVNPTRPGENVYFVLEPTEENPDVVAVLGIWTTHIALLFGKPLTDADIQSIYPRATGEPGNP